MEGNESSECTICGTKTISKRYLTYKESSCCTNLRIVHIKCAKKHYQKQYPTPIIPFNLENWASSKSIKLLCLKCRVNCLYCNVPHVFLNDNVRSVTCSNKKCTSWSYYLPPSSKNIGCIAKSKKKKKVMCQKCLSVNETDNEQETESKLREISEEGTYEEFSQISNKTNTAYHKKIYDAIYSFKNDGQNFINTFKDYNQCDDFLLCILVI